MGIFDNSSKGFFDKEILKYEALSAGKPGNAGIKNTLGDLYLKKAMTGKAAQTYKEAIILFLQERQKEKAIALIKKCISYNLFDNKTTEEIFGELLARELREDVIRIYIQLANNAMLTNRTLANDLFRKILQLDPDNEAALSFFEKGKQSSEGIDKETTLMENHANAPSEPVKEVSGGESLSMKSTGNTGQKNKEEPPSKEVEEKRRIDIKIPEKHLQSLYDNNPDELASSDLKDKFLTLAKEKTALESVILQQTDTIKKLEKENVNLSQTLKQFAENNKKMKEKLLEFDILRNMEISELKKKIETLIMENKKLISEKEIVLQNLDRDQGNILLKNNQLIDLLKKEKLELENLLDRAKEELRNKDAVLNSLEAEQKNVDTGKTQLIKEKEELAGKITSMQETVKELLSSVEIKEIKLAEKEDSLSNATSRIQQIESELSSLKGSHIQLENENNALKAEKGLLSEQLADLTGEKSSIEEGQTRKILSYSEEIADLKTDVDELTSSMEEKIKYIDELNEKVALLNKELSHKDVELHEKIPLLLAKINELSVSIDRKMEENSLFTKELFDLNQKLTGLHEELTQKDELLIEISSEYKKEREELLAKINDLETDKERIENESKNLYAGIEEIRDRESEYKNLFEESDKDRKELEEQLSEALKKIVDLEEEYNKHLSVMSSRDLSVSEIQGKHASEISGLMEEIETLRSENLELVKRGLDLENENKGQLASIASRDQLLSEIQDKHDSEMSVYLKEIESLKSENAELRKVWEGKEQTVNLLSSEKADLLRKISASAIEFEKLQEGKNKEISRIEEELGSAFSKISDLEDRLEITLNENTILREKLEEIPERISPETHEIQVAPEAVTEKEGAPAYEFQEKVIFKEKRRWSLYGVYSALVIILILSSIFLYRHYSPGLISKKPAVPAINVDSLSYSDIFSMMTRVNSSGNMKMQATMITEPLMRKENAGKDLPKYDFIRYFYFKININSLKGPLGQDLVKNPVSVIQLSDGLRNIPPAAEIKTEETRTFYKREDPVSITFVSAFPRDKDISNLRNLKLSMSHAGNEIQLIWDIQSLKTNKAIQ